MNRRLIVQIIHEFWLQTIIASVWATYRTWQTPAESISVFITNFGGSFFLASWAFGQYMRIKKQQRVEDEFQSVKEELRKLLSSLEQQTKHLIGHTTGGDSIGYFAPMALAATTQIQLTFINASEYPVFDVIADWIDLNETVDPAKGRLWTRHPIALGTIQPHRAVPFALGFDMSSIDNLRINIFIQTRNRNITQEIKAIKVGGKIKIATNTHADNFKKIEVPADFPGYEPENPDKIFA